MGTASKAVVVMLLAVSPTVLLAQSGQSSGSKPAASAPRVGEQPSPDVRGTSKASPSIRQGDRSVPTSIATPNKTPGSTPPRKASKQ